MNETPTVDQFQADLVAVIERYRAAQLLSLAELVGTMHVIIATVMANAFAEDDDDEYG